VRSAGVGLVDDEVELLFELVVLVAAEVRVHLQVDLVEELPELGALHESLEELVARHAGLHLEHLELRGVGLVLRAVGLFEEGLGLGDEAVAQARLLGEEALDAGLWRVNGCSRSSGAGRK
jgi:hypothetical protein